MGKIVKKIILAVLAATTVAAASENIINYSSPVTVNNFFQWGDTLWAATSGGLRVHNLKTGGAELISNSRTFPDLHLTAICRDDRGNLWIGSRKGYLYKMTPRGQFTAFSNYKLADWGILALYSFDGLIVVGSNRGVSLFDPVKGVALRNAVNIANFSNPRVNAILASADEDTLFLGCNEGVAYLDGLHAVPLTQRNFYYSGIWKTKRVGPVISLVQTADSVMASPVPAIMFRGVTVTVADSGWIRYAGWIGGRGRPITTGNILTLYNEGDKRFWFGTDEHFYYSYEDDTAFVQHKMNGMTLRRGTRVMAADDGSTWFLPVVSLQNPMWHHGVYRFDGRHWSLYSQDTHYERFGYVGDDNMLGITQGHGGSVWVGTWGGNIKHINHVNNTVAQLGVGNRDYKNIVYSEDGAGIDSWGKVDALAMDTSGYLWVSVFDNNHGSLICYDQRYRPVSSLESNPVRAHYRRFFTESPFKTQNVTLLSVDADNRIFAYDAPQNRLTVFRHSGNPLADSITIDTVYTSTGTVSAIETGEDGTAYIATIGGLLRLRPRSLNLENVLQTDTNFTSIAVWGNTLWLGTNTSGILRYDTGKNEKVWINEASGLPSNNVASVAVDRKAGNLWIVTDEGISRLDIGRNVKPAQKRQMRVFPNVFSVSGSNQGASHVTFAELEPQSAVSVYAVNGSLVAKVDARYFNDSEWRAVWAPKRSLSPGTYIVTVKPSGKKAKIILRP